MIKNKRGFTLIEIIGIVTILSLMLLLAVPAITKTLKRNEQNKYDDYIDNLKLATESYIVGKLKEGVTIEDTYYVTLGDLIDAKYVQESVKNPENEGTLSRKTSIKVTKNLDGTRDYSVQEHYLLPDKYTLVEYIESTGTQYIDTGVKPNNNTRMVLDFENTTTNTSDLYMLFGARNYYNNSAFGVAISSSRAYSYWENNAYTTYGFVLNTKKRMIYDVSADAFIIDNLSTKGNDVTFSTTYSIALLSLNSNTGYDTRCAIGKIYSSQIYDNDVLVRDFVPCYRKSDGVIGLYDLVEGKFYSNLGSGNFIKGNDVIPTSTPEAPIEIESVGEYDETTGKYKIPVKVSNSTEEITTNIYLNEPLRKIGDYEDYIDFKNKKVVRNIKEITFNGTENWKKNPYGTNAYYLVDNTALTMQNLKLIDSTHFKGVSYNDRTITENNIIFIDDSYDAINVRNTEHTNLNSFTTFLKNNQVKVNYVLTTPMEEDIDLPDIKLFEGINVITIDTKIKTSEFKVTYYNK